MLRRRRNRRPPRLKGLSINRLIPNIITVSATCSGLTAIRFAVDHQWKYAIMALIVAAILDALDGRMARILKAESEFGAQLDSLSDFVSFGVAPAFVIYFWALSQVGGLGWVIALFFIVCCGLRLARFNSMIGKLPPYAYNYFTGVPAPAGALLAMLPMTVSFIYPLPQDVAAVLASIWLVAVAIIMVSRMPTFSFKKLKVPQKYVLPGLAGVGLIVAGMASFPWTTLSIAGLAYMATFPFSVRSFRRLKQEAELLQETADQQAAESENSPVQLRTVDER